MRPCSVRDAGPAAGSPPGGVTDRGLRRLSTLTGLQSLRLGGYLLAEGACGALAGLLALTSLQLRGCDALRDEGLHRWAGEGGGEGRCAEGRCQLRPGAGRRLHRGCPAARHRAQVLPRCSQLQEGCGSAACPASQAVGVSTWLGSSRPLILISSPPMRSPGSPACGACGIWRWWTAPGYRTLGSATCSSTPQGEAGVAKESKELGRGCITTLSGHRRQHSKTVARSAQGLAACRPICFKRAASHHSHCLLPPLPAPSLQPALSGPVRLR